MVSRGSYLTPPIQPPMGTRFVRRSLRKIVETMEGVKGKRDAFLIYYNHVENILGDSGVVALGIELMEGKDWGRKQFNDAVRNERVGMSSPRVEKGDIKARDEVKARELRSANWRGNDIRISTGSADLPHVKSYLQALMPLLTLPLQTSM